MNTGQPTAHSDPVKPATPLPTDTGHAAQTKRNEHGATERAQRPAKPRYDITNIKWTDCAQRPTRIQRNDRATQAERPRDGTTKQRHDGHA